MLNLSKPLSVGLAISIEKLLDAQHIKHKTAVAGWEDGNFIMIHTPTLNGTPVTFDRDEPCALKFISNGQVFGFKTTILQTQKKPAPLVFVKYPADFENVSLRRFKRIQTYIMTRFQHTNKSTRGDKLNFDIKTPLQGVIVDLSAGGGLISFANPATPIRMGEIIVLSFTLPDGKQVVNLIGEIKNARIEEGKKMVGIAFTRDNPTAFEMVGNFFRNLIVPDQNI